MKKSTNKTTWRTFLSLLVATSPTSFRASRRQPGHCCLLLPTELRQRRCQPWVYTTVATKHPPKTSAGSVGTPLLLWCRRRTQMASWAQDTNRPEAETPHLLLSFRRFVTFYDLTISSWNPICVSAFMPLEVYFSSYAIHWCVASRAFSYLICIRCVASSPPCCCKCSADASQRASSRD